MTMTREGRRRKIRYFPRRSSATTLCPTSPRAKASGSGWRTMLGKRRSTASTLRPTISGRRSDAIVSTSGSSGTHQSYFAHLGPVRARLRLHLQPALQLVGGDHHPRHQLRESLRLVLGDLEDQLVVDLE